MKETAAVSECFKGFVWADPISGGVESRSHCQFSWRWAVVCQFSWRRHGCRCSSPLEMGSAYCSKVDWMTIPWFWSPGSIDFLKLFKFAWPRVETANSGGVLL